MQPRVLASIELESFVCAEALYMRAAAPSASPSASPPVDLASVVIEASAASSSAPAPVVLSAMFGSRLFDQRVLRLVAQALGQLSRN